MTDERFVELLEQRHLSLLAVETSTAAGGSKVASEANLDAETLKKLADAEDCLRLIERVRRAESARPDRGAAASNNPVADSSNTAAGATNDMALLGELLQSVATGPTKGTIDGSWLGRFRILRQLGQGGHAIVFLAWDPTTRREVALKTPRPDALFSDELRQRFVREGIAAARLSHPHIVTVFEVGQAGPIAYIVSAYCQGRSLAAMLAERVPIPVPLAAKWVEQLATGVEHAHCQGVWHRDVKPGNVLLEPDTSAGRPERAADRRIDLSGLTPKLTDFGLAKVREYVDLPTRTGALLGTPAYMAPEQVDGSFGAVGPATDVYGLGVLLYEMLTGAPPFRGSSEADVLRQVANQEPLAPRQLCRELPRDLEAIVLACLEKSPARRYPSAGALADDLARFRRGEPTRVRPLGPLRRGWKAVSLRPTRSIALALALLLPLVVLGGLFWHREALDRADTAAHQLRRTSLGREQQLAEIRYASDVRLAYQAWQSRDALQAASFLTRQIPATGAATDRRGFFWWRLWSLVHGQPKIVGPADGAALAVAFSPDGATLATAGNDGTVRLWNAASGALEAELLGHTADVNSIAFSPDGRRLASACDDRTLRIWNVAERQLAKTLHAGAAVNSVVFHPVDDTLIAGDERGVITVWRADTTETPELLHGHTREVNQVALSPDGTRLASAGSDAAIVLWDMESHSQIAALKGHTGSVTAVAFSPDGQRLASGGVDHSVRLWQVDPPQLLLVLRGHAARVDNVAFASDELLATAGKDGTLRLWNTTEGEPVWTYLTKQERVWGIQASPGEELVATAGATGGVRLWPFAKQAGEPTIRLAAQGLGQGRFAFAAHRNLFVSCDPENRWTSLDLSSREPRVLSCDDAREVNAVWFGSDDESLCFVSQNGSLYQYDVASGDRRTTSFKLEHSGYILSSISDRRRWLAIAGLRSSRRLTVCDLSDFAAQPKSFVLPTFTNSMAFTPDEETLLVVLDEPCLVSKACCSWMSPRGSCVNCRGRNFRQWTRWPFPAMASISPTVPAFTKSGYGAGTIQPPSHWCCRLRSNALGSHLRQESRS